MRPLRVLQRIVSEGRSWRGWGPIYAILILSATVAAAIAAWWVILGPGITQDKNPSSVATATPISTATPLPSFTVEPPTRRTPVPSLLPTLLPTPTPVADSTLLTVNQIVASAIREDGELDLFGFRAEAGGLYVVNVGLGTLYRSKVTIWDVDGVTAMAESDAYESSSIRWVAPTSDTYYLSVEGANGTGTYTLAVLENTTPLPTPGAKVIPITVNQALRGVIEISGGLDLFSFEAEAGALYVINFGLDTPGNSELTLWDIDGVTVLAEYNTYETSPIRWVAAVSGTYYLGITSFEQTGTYMVSLQSVNSIPTNLVRNGVIEISGELDLFSFQAEADVLYVISLRLGTRGYGKLTLWDLDGATVLSEDRDYRSPRITWVAPVAGTYYLGFSIFDWTGKYTLTIQDRIELVTTNEVVNGVIEISGESDLFNFHAEADRIYVINVALSTLDGGELTLRDIDGVKVLAEDDSYESLRIAWIAPASGSYYLEVMGDNSETGRFTLEVVEATPFECPETPLPISTIVTKLPTTGTSLQMPPMEYVVPNQALSIIGRGFTRGGQANINDGVSIGGEVVVSSQINDGFSVDIAGDGNWAARVVIPVNCMTLTPGNYKLRVSDTEGRTGVTELLIKEPILTLSPSVSRVRSLLTIEGTSFPASNSYVDNSPIILIAFGCGKGCQGTTIGMPDTFGSFRTGLEVPSQTQIPSENTVKAYTIFVTQKSTNYTVAAIAAHRVPPPTISLDLSEGFPGTVVTITGEDFRSFTVLERINISRANVLAGRTWNTDRGRTLPR